MILLNTTYLNYPDDLKIELMDTVKACMIEKFSGTGVIITEDSMTATQFLSEGNNDLRVIALHNMEDVAPITPGALGVAVHGTDLGFVSVDEFRAPDVRSLAEQIGTVASHEAGHLFLPHGHSIDSPNLMSEGDSLNETLTEDNGRSLAFTDVQKALIRGDIPFGQDVTLGNVETYWAAVDTYTTSDDTTDMPDDIDTDLDTDLDIT